MSVLGPDVFRRVTTTKLYLACSEAFADHLDMPCPPCKQWLEDRAVGQQPSVGLCAEGRELFAAHRQAYNRLPDTLLLPQQD